MAVLLTTGLVACGDDGGTDAVDAPVSSVDSGQTTIDAPLNGVDAPPAIDATPLPPDASTAGRACSFPDSMMLSTAGMLHTGMVCIDADTGNNCRVIVPGQASCFNNQVGFYFIYHSGQNQRSIAGTDGLTLTATSGTGTLMNGNVVSIADGVQGTVTGQASGQSYTLAYQYNSGAFTISLPSLSGP